MQQKTIEVGRKYYLSIDIQGYMEYFHSNYTFWHFLCELLKIGRRTKVSCISKAEEMLSFENEAVYEAIKLLITLPEQNV